MKTTLKLVLISFIILFLGASCEDSTIVEPLSDDVEEQENEEERIFIVDHTNKRWDITHAVKTYGFEPNKFQFGLGPNAIRPILNPEMLSPGEEGYPSDDRSFIVQGASVNDYTRAYPLDIMSRHEVVDEQFGETYVAVAY